MIILGLLMKYTPLGKLMRSWSGKTLWNIITMLLWLLGVQLTLLAAAIAYVTIYQIYIPVNSLSLPLDFDFSTEEGAYAVAKLQGDMVSLNYVEPARNTIWKYIPFSSSTPDMHSEMVSHNKVTTFGRPQDRIKALRFMNMPYSVYVNLHLPETDRNLATGNFMIRVSFADDLELFRSTHRLTRDNRKRWPLTHNEEYAVRPNVGSIRKMRTKPPTDTNSDRSPSLFTATRPAILAFKSATMRLLDTLIFSPLYLTGWRKQQQHLDVFMASNWHVPSNLEDYEFAYAIVELDRTVDLYGAQIEWRVEWTGLRYFMYHFRILAFVLGTGMLWYMEVFYLVIMYWLGRKFCGLFFSSQPQVRPTTRPPTRLVPTEDRDRTPTRSSVLQQQGETPSVATDDLSDTDTPSIAAPGKLSRTRSSEIQMLLEDSEASLADSTMGESTDRGSWPTDDEVSVDENESLLSLSASDSNVEGYQERQSSRIEIPVDDSDDNSQTIRYPVSWPTPPPEEAGHLALTREEIEGLNRYRYYQPPPGPLRSVPEHGDSDYDEQPSSSFQIIYSESSRGSTTSSNPSSTVSHQRHHQTPTTTPLPIVEDISAQDLTDGETTN